ncbi:MAG: response regulator [Patescibacteria group bacterium]|nr:response regulator [Patescibacteria group bacterium]
MSEKVLIAEDEISMQNVLKSKVEQLGFKVIQSFDGKEALQKVKTEKPDLILLDIIMPEKSGFEVLKELKLKQKSKIPVVILTNLGQENDIKMAKELGAVDYILKANISLRDLMVKISNYLQKK